MTSCGVVRAATIASILSSCEVAAGPERIQQVESAISIRIETKAADDDILKIVIVSQRTASVSTIPSLKLRNVATGEEYWSPFDNRGRPLIVNGRVLIKRGITEVSLRLSGVKWARSRAALWPSRSLEETVPPGRYEVVARLSPGRERLVESNRAAVMVSRSE
jgi:hypothetical protein